MPLLKIVWLELLDDESLRMIGQLGVCGHHTRWPVLPFYSPAFVPSRDTLRDPDSELAGDSMDTLYVGRNVGRSVEVAAPNHAWVEVTHCGAGKSTPHKPFNTSSPPAWKYFSGPAWFLAAPGSGVSINVGRTIVMSEPAAWRATQLLTRSFQGSRAECDQHGKGWWRMREHGWQQPHEHPWLPEHALPPGLDSIQILDHKWVNSAEHKSEIILLREAECASVKSMHGSRIRCGRHPFLVDVREPSCQRHLERMENCHAPGTIVGPRAAKLGVKKVDCNSAITQANANRLWEEQISRLPAS